MYGEDIKSEEEEEEENGKLPGEEEDEEKRNKVLKEEIVQAFQNNGNTNLLLPGTHDVVDHPPNDYVFRYVDVGFLIFGTITLLADWVFDIIAVYNHWRHEDFMWFTMTVVFMSCSSLVIMGVSLWWYIKDRGKEEVAEVSRGRWVARFILLPLQLAPLLRYYETLVYGLKSRMHWKRYRESGSEEDVRKQKEYYTWMLYEDSDCVFLRMFECFMESAPQLILQLYILIRTDDPVKYSTTWRYLISMSSLVSLVSLAWGVTAFTRSTRFTALEKKNISIAGSAAIFFWQFFILAARVTAMVAFASIFQLWLVYVCAAHCVLMAVWLLSRRLKNLRSSPLWEITLSILMGIIYIFVFLNDEDKPTRWKYVIYYTIYEVENVVMIVMWLLCSDPTTAYYLTAFFIHICTFVLGLIIMQVYYKFLHPDTSPPHPQCQQPQDKESRELETNHTELEHVHEC